MARRDVWKRRVDMVVAALALAILAVPLGVIAVLVRRNLGSPVLFTQERPGLHGEIFRLYKFRTMREAVGPDGRPLPDSERLTAFGRILRSTSMDELPELWNVLRGDMSLVGPRPLLVEYLDRYTPEQARRHDVRPGITGLAQVEGRNSASWARKLALDVWYVDNHSLWLDLCILCRTLAKVVSREGISAPGEATMHPFRGDEEPGSAV